MKTLILLITCGVSLTLHAEPKRFLVRERAELGYKYGYIDETGTLVIPFAYREAQPFSDGLAWVEQFEGQSYIDPSGKPAFRVYGPGEPFHCETAVYRTKVEQFQSKRAAVDRQGKTLYTPERFEVARGIYSYGEIGGAFCSDLAPFAVQDPRGGNGAMLWGYRTRAGVRKITPRYTEASEFSDGLAIVSQGGAEKVIDTSDNLVFAFPKRAFSRHRIVEGKIAYCAAPHRCGHLSARGGTITAAGYSAVEDFSQGLAAVRSSGGKWGFVDDSGKLVVPARHGLVKRFSEGLAPVSKDSRDSWCFSQDNCRDEIDGTWEYVDATGKTVLPAKYDQAEPFTGGLARVVLDGGWAYIDRTGKAVWRETLPVTETPKQTPTDRTAGLGDAASQRALVRAELEPLPLETLRLIRNQVMARHGYSFKSADLREYFGALPWYKPDPAYTEDRLTSLERDNVRLLKEIEAARK